MMGLGYIKSNVHVLMEPTMLMGSVATYLLQFLAVLLEQALMILILIVKCVDMD
jgi:hypothetical protein